jgi:hypothetical protein
MNLAVEVEVYSIKIIRVITSQLADVDGVGTESWEFR